MPGFNPDKINIHDLTIEEPEKQSEVIFDPEKEITEQDWQKIKNKIHKLEELYVAPTNERERDDAGSKLSACAMDLKIIDPTKKICSYEPFYNDTQDKLKKYEEKEDWWSFLIVAGEYKVVFPDNKFDISQKTFDKIKNHLVLLEMNNNWQNFADTAARFKIVAPEQVINIDRNCRFNLKKQLESNRDFTENNMGEQYAPSFSSLAASMKILGEELDIDERSWDLMRKQLECYRKSDRWWTSFLTLSRDMVILSADEIHTPEGGGLELMHHKKTILKPETPQMPESRNF